MPTDRFGEPWPERTYNGFAGSGSAPALDATVEPRRSGLPRVSGRTMAIGAAGAITLGLVLGVWARPNFGKSPGDAAERSATPVPIEVTRPAPQTVPLASGKLEVLSPDQAAQARAANSAGYAPTMAPPTSGYVPAVPPPLPSVAVGPAYRPAPAPAQAPLPAPIAREAPPPAALPAEPPRMAQAPTPNRAGFDCSGARTPAEAMVCGDPEIASADREMARAYRRALQSGAAPPEAVRQEQRDFLAIREDAARHSRRALAQIYRQRIDDLNALADSGDGRSPDN